MTIHKIGPPSFVSGSTVTQEYRVTRVAADGTGRIAEHVSILVDFDKLADFTLRAVYNNGGKAVLYYGAVIAECIKP